MSYMELDILVIYSLGNSKHQNINWTTMTYCQSEV